MIFRFLIMLFLASPLVLARDGVEADPMGGSQSAPTNLPVANPAAESSPDDPMGGAAPVENKEAVTEEKSEATPSVPVEDPMAGAAAQTSSSPVALPFPQSGFSTLPATQQTSTAGEVARTWP